MVFSTLFSLPCALSVVVQHTGGSVKTLALEVLSQSEIAEARSLWLESVALKLKTPPQRVVQTR